MSTPLEGTASAALAIDRVKYTHDAMIDLLLMDPGITQNKLAQHFGYSVGWVSRIMNSDAFLARLASRKTEVVDPTIRLTLEERLNAVANVAADILLDKMLLTKSSEIAIKALEISSKALGYGARAGNIQQQNNFVVALPVKATTTAEWMDKARAMGLEAGKVSEAMVINSPDLVQLVASE